MLKRIVAAALLAVLAVSFAACTKPAPAPAPSAATTDSERMQKIKKAGKLIMGTESGFAPYEFVTVKDGKSSVEGMDIDIAREIAKDLGVELVVEDMVFDALIAAVQTGAVDIAIAGLTPTAERKESVDFSSIYFLAKQTVMVRKGEEAAYPTPDAFAGKIVGAQKGSLQEALLESDLSKATPRVIDAIPNMVIELLNKQIDGIVMEGPVADNWLRSRANELAVVPFTIPDPDGGNAIAIPKGSPDLLDAINASLKRLQDAGQIDKFLLAATELYDAQPK